MGKDSRGRVQPGPLYTGVKGLRGWTEWDGDPFQVPSYWKRLAGLDVGFNVTAAVFIAHDTQNDVVYVAPHHDKNARVAIVRQL